MAVSTVGLSPAQVHVGEAKFCLQMHQGSPFLSRLPFGLSNISEMI